MPLSRREQKKDDGKGRTNMGALVPLDLHQQIKHLCIESGETLSDFVTRACQIELNISLAVRARELDRSTYVMGQQPDGYRGHAPFGGHIPEDLAETVREYCDDKQIGRRVFLIDALRAHCVRLGIGQAAGIVPRKRERKIVL